MMDLLAYHSLRMGNVMRNGGREITFLAECVFSAGLGSRPLWGGSDGAGERERGREIKKVGRKPEECVVSTLPTTGHLAVLPTSS